uniref:Aminotransferase-like plant mobile domain-containing protein n=1 Tax=Fagus sylvatica TaxID=28930 RepID=A0A2N9I7V0_FAGSY
MTEPPNTIFKFRDELMVPPIGDHKPSMRPAHFLNPSVTFSDEPIFEFPSLSPSSLPPTFEPSKWPLKLTFISWQQPRNWKSWVDSLRPKFEPLWKKTGIFESIMNSTYFIRKNDDLFIGIAERWCCKTNTCIFPWAEVTLTLEDTMVLGGFSVLGQSINISVETQELKEVEDKLLRARVEIGRSKARKASSMEWMKLFMNSGSEIEHEAFLVMWLSVFVLPNSQLIRKQVFPIAIHLARGTRIALAPAVLSSIYMDLCVLKRTIVGLNKFDPGEDGNSVLEVIIRSPFQLVQIWVWERFQALQPNPNLVICGEPVFARWHKIKSVNVENVRLALDSAGDSFLWRPYASYASNSDMWVPVDPNLDEEIVAFTRCLRVSELVGLGCTEQYFPHRVAMQFGMDQDLPGCVTQCKKTPEIAWNDYNKQISDVKLFVPSRLYEGCVTTRYLEWWKQSILGQRDSIRCNPRRQRSRMQRSRRKKSIAMLYEATQALKGNDGDVPPGFPLCNKVKAGNSVNVDKPTVVEDKTPQKQVPQASRGRKEGNDADVPPGFPPKRNKVEVGNSFKEDKSAGEGMRLYVMHDSLGKSPICDVKHLLGQSQSFSCGKNGVNDVFIRKMKSVMKPVELHTGEAERGGLESAMEVKSEGEAKSLVHNRANICGNEGEGSSYKPEISRVELKDRIIRLKREFAELKAAILG